MGAWEPVQTLAWRPVHSHMLPTGKVMFWPDKDDPRLWDPASGSVTPLPQAGYNIFCSGHSFLANGSLLVTGGKVDYAPQHGLPYATSYDPFAIPPINPWTQLPGMNAGRWYPTNVTLGNGDVVVMAGIDEGGNRNLIPQVWQVGSSSWRTLSSASLILKLYPAAFLPNGKVFVATATSRYLDTAGTGAWTTVATHQVSDRDDYGSACMYDNGKIIYTGGANPPVASAEVIDLNAPTPAWTLVAPMPQARRQHNVTILPEARCS